MWSPLTCLTRDQARPRSTHTLNHATRLRHAALTRPNHTCVRARTHTHTHTHPSSPETPARDGTALGALQAAPDPWGMLGVLGMLGLQRGRPLPSGHTLTPVVTSGVGRLLGPPEKRL